MLKKHLDIVPSSMYNISVNTRDKLIEATRDLLWERGYVGTSPRDIQARAGAGQGSMYHHFTGKEQLAIAAISKTVEEMKKQLESIFDDQDTAYNRISAYILRKREILKGCPMGRLVQDPEIISNPQLRKPVNEMIKWIQERIACVIAEGCENGEFHDVDPNQVSATIHATLQGSYVLARSEESVEPFEKAILGLLELLKALRKDK
jgi:AcrR family transcriptional regulator